MLADGHAMPVLGLGTWPLDDDGARAVVGDALRAGYRLVDTATNYGNERGVGRAVREAEIPREELFVTTKLPGAQHGHREALAGLDESLDRLGLEDIDLYLIHWPLPMVGKYVDTWRAFVELRDQGKARSIGVSNFTPAQIEEVTEATGVPPVVNQIEVHPEFSQAGLRAWHDAHAIVTESYSPLGPDTAVGKFLAKNGPGLHHVAYAVDDIDATLPRLAAAGIQLIDSEPRVGIRDSRVAFLHPRSTGGVLTEIVEPAGGH